MPTIPTLEDLLKAGAHFGHSLGRWHPKMAPYIFTQRNGVHILNLEKTQEALKVACDALRDAASEGKIILFVGTKKQAKDIIAKHAREAGIHWMAERWIGGLLTNWNAVQNLLKRYREIKKMQETGEIQKYTKGEQVKLAKDAEKMEKSLIGIVSLERVPDMLFIQDVRTDKTAVREAGRLHIPTVGICDSNVNPELVTYPIPANDDAIKAIDLIVGLLAEAVREGKQMFEVKKQAEEQEKAKENKGPKVIDLPSSGARVKEVV